MTPDPSKAKRQAAAHARRLAYTFVLDADRELLLQYATELDQQAEELDRQAK